MSLEDVLEFIAVANLVFLLVNRIYLDQARLRYITLNAKTFTNVWCLILMDKAIIFLSSIDLGAVCCLSYRGFLNTMNIGTLTQSYVPRVFGFKLHKPWRKFLDRNTRIKDRGFGFEKGNKQHYNQERRRSRHACMSSGTYTLQASQKVRLWEKWKKSFNESVKLEPVCSYVL